MRAPSVLSLSEVQQSFRDVHTLIAPLAATTPYDWKQRRLMNLLDGRDTKDAVTLGQITALLGALRTDLTPHTGVDGALSEGPIRVGVFATRGASAAHRGELFFASDHNYVGWVSDGAAWRYASGLQRGVIASITTGLTTADAGYLYVATNYARAYRWTGAAWENAPGEDNQGEIRFFAIAPGTGWQLCDGTATTRSTATGTTTAVTVPNFSTAAYVKAATSLTAGPTAASGVVASVSDHAHNIDPPSTVSSGPSGTTDVQSGAGSTVASSGHTHTTDISGHPSGNAGGHDHAPGTLELRRTELLTYYRL